MNYQLVLQWPSPLSVDLDDIVQAEDRLIESLSDEISVDGHDIGASEANIFILTDDPISTFGKIRDILGKDSIWAGVRVAYREVTGSDYFILYPEGLTAFQIA